MKQSNSWIMIIIKAYIIYQENKVIKVNFQAIGTSYIKTFRLSQF